MLLYHIWTTCCINFHARITHECCLILRFWKGVAKCFNTLIHASLYGMIDFILLGMLKVCRYESIWMYILVASTFKLIYAYNTFLKALSISKMPGLNLQRRKSKKEVMDEIIAKSKFFKVRIFFL